MKLSIAEHGGWSAPLAVSRPRAPHIVDSEKLEPAATQELKRLVAALKSAEPPAHGVARAPEAMSYTITIEDSGDRAEYRQSDIIMSPEFAALLEWLQAQP